MEYCARCKLHHIFKDINKKKIRSTSYNHISALPSASTSCAYATQMCFVCYLLAILHLSHFPLVRTSYMFDFYAHCVPMCRLLAYSLAPPLKIKLNQTILSTMPWMYSFDTIYAWIFKNIPSQSNTIFPPHFNEMWL